MYIQRQYTLNEKGANHGLENYNEPSLLSIHSLRCAFDVHVNSKCGVCMVWLDRVFSKIETRLINYLNVEQPIFFLLNFGFWLKKLIALFAPY